MGKAHEELWHMSGLNNIVYKRYAQQLANTASKADVYAAAFI